MSKARGMQEDPIVWQGTFLCITVLACGEGTWHVDHELGKIDDKWKLLVLEEKSRYQNYNGKVIHTRHQIPSLFFNILNLGRPILSAIKGDNLPQNRLWQLYDINRGF